MPVELQLHRTGQATSTNAFRRVKKSVRDTRLMAQMPRRVQRTQADKHIYKASGTDVKCLADMNRAAALMFGL